MKRKHLQFLVSSFLQRINMYCIGCTHGPLLFVEIDSDDDKNVRSNAGWMTENVNELASILLYPFVKDKIRFLKVKHRFGK